MIATYRLQLTPDFGFASVQDLLPYFQQLGVSHLYLSPITEATAGSQHGYDVLDHNVVRVEFGGREGFDRLLEAARRAQLELILDFVPNHAGVGPYNEAWQEVLAYGPHAPQARLFDIDWEPLEETLTGNILLPFLGKTYGEVLDQNEITLAYESGRFFARYFDNRFALAPATYSIILAAALPALERTEVYFDLKDLNDAYNSLMPPEFDKANMLAQRLASLSAIDWQPILARFQGTELHQLLERQHWRLAYWKTASYEINYRRFFDTNSLVALRMEDEAVFWSAHRLLGDLLIQEGVAGVRIDHIDGLFDPHAYLERLRSLSKKKIWVEKILARGEVLPADWRIEGTTGYEFMNDVLHLLVDPDGYRHLKRIYQRFVPEPNPYDEVVRNSKRIVMKTSLASELNRLAHGLNQLSKADYHTRDFTMGALRAALSEVVAAIDRYRTYVPYDRDGAQAVIKRCIHRARRRMPAFEPSVWEFLARVIAGELSEELREKQRAWVGRFQQYTAPVAAKGVEDTAFYRYLPLIALNEVGGDPEVVEQPVQSFHSHARYRAQNFPLNLLASATHDHKRGEDTRMRLLALSEMPDRWEETLKSLGDIAQHHRRTSGPSKYDEYLFYQILLSQWEDVERATLADRLWQYMQKASRESKRQTSWMNPDEAYETDLESFVRGLVADERMTDAIGPLANEIAQRGMLNSITQLVLKFTAPGIPDIYRGCELLDLSLVDPDNRRPVDFERRRALLEGIQSLLDQPCADEIRRLVENRDPRAKLYFITRLLRLRRSHAQLLSHGAYISLSEEGLADRWIAYARKRDQELLVVVVPRLRATLHEQAESSLALPDEIANQDWKDVLTGASIRSNGGLNLGSAPLPWIVLEQATA